MKQSLNQVIAFMTGGMFGIGLVISGMALPEKVIGFLDIAGHWDMSLAFVMGGALIVFMPGYLFWVRPHSQPVIADTFSLPSYPKIDLRLVFGSIIFGVGWGIAGICPGPALASLSLGHVGIWVFFAGMMVGLGGTSFVLCKIKQRSKKQQEQVQAVEYRRSNS
jgi:uncharacterized membrane protein YedE/YeeE